MLLLTIHLIKEAYYKKVPAALADLLHTFNGMLSKKLYNGKYQFIACDGSAVDIFRNPDDPDTFFEPNGKSTWEFNQIRRKPAQDHLVPLS